MKRKVGWKEGGRGVDEVARYSWFGLGKERKRRRGRNGGEDGGGGSGDVVLLHCGSMPCCVPEIDRELRWLLQGRNVCDASTDSSLVCYVKLCQMPRTTKAVFSLHS